jgi:hypothetical protein
MAHGRTDYDKLKQRFLQRQRQASSDGQWFKPEAGRYRVRVLPPPPNHNMWYMEYGVHYGLTNEAGDFETITCPRLTIKKPCPICEFTRGLWRTGIETDQQIARKFGVKKRFVSNVLVLTQSQSDVRMWAYGPTVHGQLEEHCITPDGAIIPIDDPDNGINMKVAVTIKTTGDGTFPNYIVSPEPQAVPLPDPTALSRLHDFVTIITGNLKSYDEIRSVLNSGEGTSGGSSDVSSTETVDRTPEPEAPTTQVTTEETVEETVNATTGQGQGQAQGQARPTQEELVRRAKAAMQKRGG